MRANTRNKNSRRGCAFMPSSSTCRPVCERGPRSSGSGWPRLLLEIPKNPRCIDSRPDAFGNWHRRRSPRDRCPCASFRGGARLATDARRTATNRRVSRRAQFPRLPARAREARPRGATGHRLRRRSASRAPLAAFPVGLPHRSATRGFLQAATALRGSSTVPLGTRHVHEPEVPARISDGRTPVSAFSVAG